MRRTFLVPNLDPLKEIPSSDSDNIVVVSIIGKTAFSSHGFKVKELGRMFSSDHQRRDSDLWHTIEGYYDEENQIVYLHAHTLLDTDCLLKHYESIRISERYKNDEYDFLSVYDEVKNIVSKIMLFLFYSSHIVILSHPGSSFDTNYVQYFKALNTLSQKLTSKAPKFFENLDDISKDWLMNGRTCIPRLLFYFERCPKGVTNIKKLEHNMEDRIYHILKKTRILTVPYPIFALPLNQEFVYVSQEPVVDIKREMLRGLISDCQPGGAITMTAPFSTQTEHEHSFKKMLKEHIKQARSKGFYDPVMPRQSSYMASHFELPLLSTWVDATKIMYDRVIITKFSAHLNIETKFSEQRCLKVLPIALAKYQEGLPSHYGKAEHEARLAVALNLFRAQARGALYPKYAKQLQKDCLDHWTNGRQQCEAPSLTGNPCKLPKHDCDQDHVSGFVYKAACDCGRKIGSRDDPYNAKQANYTFYQQMAKDCYCSKVERIPLSILESSIEPHKSACSDSDDKDENSDTVARVISSQYLIGMLTLSSPPGFLPEFSSWSLVSIGLSSLYSHNIGLSESYHPGFLSSTNYLLPWDVTVYAKTKANMWPQLSRSSNRGRRGRSTGSLPQFTVKVFIGMEYECPQGHKFMLSSPDKILKATPGSMVKDTGHKIAESDMPLYFPCACRAAKIAQLMRIHIVTPKAPVHCTLNPRVQPAANAPIFVPTFDGPLKLSQSSYWVLRLPYVYVADKEHFPQNTYARLLKDTFGVSEAD